MEKLTATLSFNVTKDGAKFMDSQTTFYELDKSDVVQLEGALLGGLGPALMKLAQEKA